MTTASFHSADDIAPHLPLLRRFARALTGSQDRGDRYVAALLEAILAEPTALDVSLPPRTALYKGFLTVWRSAAADEAASSDAAGQAETTAQRRLAGLTPRSRQALLLTALEGFSPEDAAAIMDVSTDDFRKLSDEAVSAVDGQTRARVLVIEDEPIIAMDIQGIVEGLGHSVVQIADTRDSAVAAALEHEPDLVLCDIQLADGSSGIDAAHEILAAFEIPVIFITAYPDRLLTGERPEPTFLITKPFRTPAVEAAISQALFFESAAVI